MIISFLSYRIVHTYDKFSLQSVTGWSKVRYSACEDVFWRKIRTSNPLENLNSPVKWRTRILRTYQVIDALVLIRHVENEASKKTSIKCWNANIVKIFVLAKKEHLWQVSGKYCFQKKI